MAAGSSSSDCHNQICPHILPILPCGHSNPQLRTMVGERLTCTWIVPQDESLSEIYRDLEGMSLHCSWEQSFLVIVINRSDSLVIVSNFISHSLALWPWISNEKKIVPLSTLKSSNIFLLIFKKNSHPLRWSTFMKFSALTLLSQVWVPNSVECVELSSFSCFWDLY